MNTIDVETTSKEISAEIGWLSEVMNTRFQLYFSMETKFKDITEIGAPIFEQPLGAYGQLVHKYKFTFEERVALALCLTSRLRPQALDIFFTKNKTFERPFVEFGGLIKGANGPFLPTGNTLLF
ncbi:MAG: ATP-binding protein, partial [Bacteroidota bacterium]